VVLLELQKTQVQGGKIDFRADEVGQVETQVVLVVLSREFKWQK
jgi:hypothetical protein